MQGRSRALLLAALLSVCAACANLSFERDTQASGTFESTGMAVTLLSFDLPKGALLIARENVSDANLANMVVTETTVIPYLGPMDWLLDIIGLRWARVRGTWGVASQATRE
ncbi:MAG: hypothetical protein JNL28_11300 [Planctomycetes bacterium]|nr:hypothetical protein [Planctomycetota bacterium]